MGGAGSARRAARRLGLLVIADGKRGDIDVTARAYAGALIGGIDSPFGRIEGLGADLATVNPLMGRDAVEPFVTAARQAGRGVLVLVRTSNPGAADIEDLRLADSGTVWERIAALVDELGAPGVGETGLSDIGAVVGATEPGHLERARELMPSAPFLLPGVGAQGGRVEDLAAAFSPGRAGGLVSASRTSRTLIARRSGSPPRRRARRPNDCGRPRGSSPIGSAGRFTRRAHPCAGRTREQERVALAMRNRSASLCVVQAGASSDVQAHRKVGREPG